MIKQIEKLAVLAIVLYFASAVLQLEGKYFTAELVNVQKWSLTQVFLLSMPITALTLAVQIFIAIWLYKIAIREKESPWIWALLGLVFGLLAPILFYLIKVYEKVNQGHKNSEQINPSDPTQAPGS